MIATIRAAWSPGEVRVAATDGDILLDYALWRPGAPDGLGDIHRGRVIAAVPAMAGAFVALADAEGFLPDSEGAKGLTAGTILTVRVTRAAQGGKGPRLSTRDAGPMGEATGGPMEGPVRLCRRGVDPLRELAARYPAAPILVDDPALAASLRPDLGERVRCVPRAFDDAAEVAVDGIAAPEVILDSGVRIAVHPTPALVAIDVDGGGALAGRDGAAQRHRALNEAVTPELARQIRLRNLSGAILVDFAGLRAKRRAALAPGLVAALASDPAQPRFLGFTALGLAEIVRPRARAPLHELLSGPLASGLAALREMARSVAAAPGRRPSLRAHPAVAAALEADPVALADLARIAGQALSLRSDPSLPAEGWRIETPHGQGSSPLPHL